MATNAADDRIDIWRYEAEEREPEVADCQDIQHPYLVVQARTFPSDSASHLQLQSSAVEDTPFAAKRHSTPTDVYRRTIETSLKPRLTSRLQTPK